MNDKSKEQLVNAFPSLDFKNFSYVQFEAGAAPESAGVEQMYSMSEGCFGTVGPALVSNGWSCVPQDRERNKRRPTVAWKEYQNTLPPAAEVKRWANLWPSHNVAIILGAGSSNAFALDIDVSTEKLAWAIREMADRVLGHTPFVRIGREPKVVLLYRLPDGAKITKTAKRFSDGEGKESTDLVEVLYNTPVTSYGRHHDTGRYFRWPEKQPLMASPSDVPVVTVAMVEQFLRECDAVRKFYKAPSKNPASFPASGSAVQYTETGKVKVPHVSESPEGLWTLDSEGRVSHGREAWLTSWTFSLCGPIDNAAYCRSEAGLNHLVDVAETVVRNYIAGDDKHNHEWIRRQVGSKVRSAAAKFASGENKHWGSLLARAEGGYERAVSQPLPGVSIEGLEWLGDGDAASGLNPDARQMRTGAPVLVEGAKESRALQTDRRGVTHRIKVQTSQALAEFELDVAAGLNAVHVLPSPTGAAKSTSTIKALLDDEHQRHLFLSPTHNNINELLRVAIEHGAKTPEMEGFYDEGAKRVVPYKGKVKAGCLRAEEVERLQAMGVGTAGLCHTKRKDALGNSCDVFCVYHEKCLFQKQLRDAEIAKVIVAAHAYLTLPTVPKALADPKSLTVDESVVLKLAHAVKMPFETLLIKRPKPRATPKEVAAGFNAKELIQDRVQACELALAAGRLGKDVASEFLGNRARHLAESALEVCKRAMTIVSKVQPDMTREKWEELTWDGGVDGETAMRDVHIEWRFWMTVLARYDRLIGDEILERTTGAKGACALGDHDYALQVLTEVVGEKEVKSWRVSWRSTPNWPGVPTLLLDASSRPEFVKVFYPGADIKTHDIQADLNQRVIAIADRTNSPSSILPRSGDGDSVAEHNVRSAQRIDEIRRLVSLVCGRTGYGRVFASAPKSVRDEVFRAFKLPANLDTAHYGAQRGIDVLKNHSAAVLIGRSEMPVWLIDGLVAALTSDTAPEEPLDILGTGYDADGRSVRRQMLKRVVQLRSGHDVNLPTPQMPTAWGRLVEEQWREEELRQAIGRLRPVFRESTPTIFLASSIIPEGVVVDKMLNLDDVLTAKGSDILFDARLTAGVIDSEILGYDCEHFLTENWSTPGFTRVTWTDGYGVEHRSLVLSSWSSDPVASIRSALSTVGVHPDWLDSADVSEPNTPVVAAGVRDPDSVSSRFLDESEYAVLEEKWSAYFYANVQAVTDNYAVERLSFERAWLAERSANA